jgi:chromosome segregation ATPase
MLTKQDLAAINQVVSNKIDPLQDKISIIDMHVRELSIDLGTLNRKLNDAELKIDTIDKKLNDVDHKIDTIDRKLNKKLDKLQRDLTTTINFFDHEHLTLKKRVLKIESHTGITSPAL